MHLCIRSTASVLFPFIAESLNYSAASQGLISFLRLHHLVSLGFCSSLLEASWFNAEWHICSLCMRLLFIHLFIDLLGYFLPNQTSHGERCTFEPPPTAAQAPSFHQCVNNGRVRVSLHLHLTPLLPHFPLPSSLFQLIPLFFFFFRLNGMWRAGK